MKENQEKETVFIRQKDIVRAVAKKCDFYQKDVNLMYDAFREVLHEMIVNSPKDKNTTIKILDGINIELKPRDGYTEYIALFGEERTVPDKLKIYPICTDHYEIRVNKERKDKIE